MNWHKNYFNNYDFVLSSVKNNAHTLEYASYELKNNYNIDIEAVKKNGLSLQYASDELKNNYNIVIEAVKKNGSSLRCASDELKNNFDIVIDKNLTIFLAVGAAKLLKMMEILYIMHQLN